MSLGLFILNINLLDRVLTQGLKASTLSRAARTPNAMQCQDVTVHAIVEGSLGRGGIAPMAALE